MRGGGSERQTLLLLQHLNRERFSPHLYVTERDGDLLKQVPDDVPIHSFQDVESPSGFYFPGRVLRQQVAHLRALIQKESIQAIYDRTFHMTMIAGKAADSLSIPRVSTIVSPPHHALPLVESRFVWLKRRRLAGAYRRASSVVAVSRQAAVSAEDYYSIGKNTVTVILNPVDIQAVRSAAKSHCDIEKDPERTNLACVGRMTQEKGHADLVEALSLSEANWPSDCQPLTVWMVGDGPLRAELQTRCDSKLSVHRVRFLGKQSNPAPIVSIADALILPSHFEGMPNVVLEAMAIGTPVIATRAGGTVELERDEQTIEWADPQDPESLSQAILRFATDPTRVKGYADAATRLVETHHDVRLTTQKIERLLSS